MSDGGRPSGPYYPPHREPLRAPWDPTDPGSGRRRSVPGARDHLRRRSALGRFVTSWGWRAYAIPILLVLTVLVVVDAMGAPDPGESGAPPVVADRPPASGGPVGAGRVPETGTLPDGGPFAPAGKGTFRIVRGGTGLVGAPGAQEFTYTVEVEDGVDVTDSGGDEAVGRMVDATLDNPKSWTADGTVAFRRVDGGTPTFRVTLTSPATVHSRCGFDIRVESSCFLPDDERVYLNTARWVRGARAFQGDIGSYRQYLVNHEVGHAVGHAAHEPCPRDGVLAPIMMQQTFGVANKAIHELDPEGVVPDDGAVCRYNPWPFPDGAPAPR